MNIAVLTASGKVIIRPDTTWERDDEDFYPPEFVNNLSYTPVVTARVCKPGRSIGRKFACRYYDSVGCGMLLYPEDLMSDGSSEGFACASCLDHSSFIRMPSESPDAIDGGIEIMKGGVNIFSGHTQQGIIEDAIAEISRFCYLRIGDIVAIELCSRRELGCREGGSIAVCGKFGAADCMDFKIIF